MNLTELGSRIRGQRERRGLKQQDVASTLGISPQAVSKWERGENAPDIAVLAPLSRVLGVSVEWILGVHGESRDVFEATVFSSDLAGAYRRSLDMPSRDFATWVNGVFFALTELTIQFDGVPVKYIGDGYLCFFSGVGHRERAVQAALRAPAAVSEDLRIGLNTGEIYLGSVGHPDYARPDIMGEVVSLAFLTMEWAKKHSESGMAATEGVLDGMPDPPQTGARAEAHFLGLGRPVRVAELVGKKV